VAIVCCLALAAVNPHVLAGSKKNSKRTAESPKELVWPLPPDNPRIRFVRSYTGAADFQRKKGKWRRLLVGPETERGLELKKPYGVTTDSAGRVYVTDTGLGAVVIFDDTAREARLLGHDGPIRLITPIGVAVDGDGRVFVSDADLDQVLRFDGEERVELALGRAEGLENPTGIAVDRERGRLYVVDSHLHKIFVYSTEGAAIATWGSRGSSTGQFNFPTNVAVDAAGNVYVVDTGNFRVQVLDREGRPLREFGEAGDAFGNFTRPKGIALDSEGHVYVVDAAFNNFQLFDQEGQLLLFVGSYGRAAGQFWLPAGIHIDKTDRVFVVDQINKRVQAFQYISDRPAPGGNL
jgi:DNA-binding beta-propeller fold protein YncE